MQPNTVRDLAQGFASAMDPTNIERFKMFLTEDSELKCDMDLPCKGHYEGPDEIANFVYKFFVSIDVTPASWQNQFSVAMVDEGALAGLTRS